MTSPCFRHPYGFDLDIVKSPSTSTRTSNTSSPSSTLSESSNCLSTRKPRTPRKRPNQTYNEAAALLSTAYPKIFSPKNLSHPSKFSRPHHVLDEPPPELLWPFRLFDEDSGFLLHQAHPEKPSFFNEAKVSSLMNYTCKSDSNSVGNSSELSHYEDDFDAESILDEEIEQGIDSIMGNLSVSKENSEDLGSKDGKFRFQFDGKLQGFGNGIMRKGVRAFRQRNDGNWWCFPIVDMLQISPRLSNKVPDSDFKPKLKLKAVAKLNSGEKKKSKVAELKNLEPAKEKPEAESSAAAGLMLKLNYDGVLDAWSDRGSPYSDEFSGADDASDRMAQIEMLFGENGVREASVLRYKEKRRTRLFSKKIRYQVRKVNADQRPRMKGRFVRRPHSSACSQRREED